MPSHSEMRAHIPSKSRVANLSPHDGFGRRLDGSSNCSLLSPPGAKTPLELMSGIHDSPTHACHGRLVAVPPRLSCLALPLRLLVPCPPLHCFVVTRAPSICVFQKGQLRIEEMRIRRELREGPVARHSKKKMARSGE